MSIYPTNDCKYDYLKAQGHTGTVDDMERSYLAGLGVPEMQVQDMWIYFWNVIAGYPDKLTYNDLASVWLGGLGYKELGSLNDQWNAYWCDLAHPPPFYVTYLGVTVTHLGVPVTYTP